MTVENPDVVFWLVMAILAMILTQSILTVAAITRFSKALGNLHLQARRLARRLTQLSEELQTLLGKIGLPLREELPGWEERISRAVLTVSRSFKELDGNAGRTLSALRTRVVRGKNRSDELLDKYSHASLRVHQAVLDPARLFSAWVAGVRVGFATFFSGKGKGPTPPSPPGQQIFS